MREPKTHVCVWTNPQGGGRCGIRLYEDEEHRHPPEDRITLAEFRKLPRLRRGRPRKVLDRPFVIRKLWPVGKDGTTFLAEAKTGEFWKGYYHIVHNRMTWSKTQEVAA